MTDPLPLLIVGTGPAGLAAARRAIAAGTHPVVLDAGLPESTDLASRRTGAVAALDTTGSLPDWAHQTPQALGGVTPRKLLLGSDEPHRSHPARTDGRSDQARLWANTVGGFSRVWGCALATFREPDMADWPAAARLTRLDYDAALAELRVLGAVDGVSDRIGPYRAPDALLPGHPALARLTSSSPAGWLIGAAALALSPDPARTCRHCGSCLAGCPWQVLFDAHDSVVDLARRRALTLLPGHLVVGIREQDDHVVVTTLTGESESSSFTAERLVLAAGSVGTTILLSRLLGRPLHLHDCQAFTLPMLRMFPVPRPDRTRAALSAREVSPAGGIVMPTVTLARMFLEHCDGGGRIDLHLQAYPPGPEIRASLARTLTQRGLPPPLVRESVRRLGDRALACHGFLPGRDSGTLRIEAGPAPEWTLERRSGDGAVLRRRLGQVSRLLVERGYLTLPGLARIEAVGGGYHHSGSVPIGSPTGSDDLGRPAGMQRIHVADAASLPALPPQPPTLSIMSHAHRIVDRLHRRGLLAR